MGRRPGEFSSLTAHAADPESNLIITRPTEFCWTFPYHLYIHETKNEKMIRPGRIIERPAPESPQSRPKDPPSTPKRPWGGPKAAPRELGSAWGIAGAALERLWGGPLDDSTWSNHLLVVLLRDSTRSNHPKAYPRAPPEPHQGHTQALPSHLGRLWGILLCITGLCFSSFTVVSR